jgi:hypothetical protein
MTHEKDQNPDDLNWMDIAREDAIDEVRHTSKRLPFLAAALSLAILGGGAVFALSTNESPAQADDISTVVSTPNAPTPIVGSSGIPVIPNVAPGTGRYGDDDEYEDDEHEDDEHEDDEHEDDDDDYEDEEDDD